MTFPSSFFLNIYFINDTLYLFLMIQLVLVSTIIGFPVQIHQEISGNKCSLQDTMTTDPPPPTLNLNPTLHVCVLSLYVTLPLSDSSSRGLWHDSQIKRITLPPTCAPTHMDRAALLILPSARTLTQITSHQPLGLNRDGSSCLSPDLLWSQIKLNWCTESRFLLTAIEPP